MNRPFTGIDDHIARLTFVDENDNAHDLTVDSQELYLGEVDDMHAAILDGKPTYLSLEETRNHVKTVLALYESARRREPVHLLEFD